MYEYDTSEQHFEDRRRTAERREGDIGHLLLLYVHGLYQHLVVLLLRIAAEKASVS